MSQQRAKLINGAALVAVVGVFGCQPMVPSAPATRGAAPAAPSYDLLAARPNAHANANSAAAAATADPCGAPPYTVTAKNPNALFTMAGTRNEIQGNIWTNDGLKMAGNREVITGDAHYRDGVTITGNSNYVAGQKIRENGEPAFNHPSVQELLASGRVFSFDADVDLRKVSHVWQAPNVLRSGIYYSTGKIVIPQNNVKGNVTLIGSAVQLPGRRHDLTAYARGVLAYATGYGANALHVAGHNGIYQGSFITPNGEFQMTGGNNLIKGTVWCDSFKMTGGFNRIHNAGTSVCPTPPPAPTPTPLPSPSPLPTQAPTPTPDPSPLPTPTAAPTVLPTPTQPPIEATPQPSPAFSLAPLASGFNTDVIDFEPQDVTADAQSYIFTANYSGRSSSKVSPTGNVNFTPITFGYRLSGIALAADGTMWAASGDDLSLLRRSSTGVLKVIPIEGNPTRVRIDKAGFVWTTTSFGDTALKFKPDGTLLATYTLPTRKPMDVAFDAGNNAYVSCGSGQIVKIPANSPSGQINTTSGATFTMIAVAGSSLATDITIDANGNIWQALSKLNKVAKVVPTATGYAVSLYWVGIKPIGIAADDRGNVWVSNSGGNSAMKVAPDGAVEATVTTGTSPQGVWFDKASGKVLVANQVSRNVTIITP